MAGSDGAGLCRARRTRSVGDSPGTGGGTHGRIVELDSVRGLAAVAILIFHANPAWLPFGWAAVDLFFVLSGYLITSIVIRNGGEDGFLKNFYVRRGLRTWPIYYLSIALLIALSPVLEQSFRWGALPYVLTYTQGVPWPWSEGGGRWSEYLEHTWSLAAEEQFYLFWPALVLIVGRRRLPLLALICAGGSVLARSRGLPLGCLLTRADGLVLGGWLAARRLGDRREAGESGGAPMAGGLTTLLAFVACFVLGMQAGRGGLGLVAVIRSHPGLTVLAFNLLWLALIDLVLTHAGRPALAPLRLPSFRRLGEISYGLYLYHFPLLFFAIEIWRGLGFSGQLLKVRLLAILVSVPVAALSWRFIERPLLEHKRRYAYSRGTEVAGAGPGGPTDRFRSLVRLGAGGSRGRRPRERVRSGE